MGELACNDGGYVRSRELGGVMTAVCEEGCIEKIVCGRVREENGVGVVFASCLLLLLVRVFRLVYIFPVQCLFINVVI